MSMVNIPMEVVDVTKWLDDPHPGGISRFFTYHTGHYPNNCAYQEITVRNEAIHHMDDGTFALGTDPLHRFTNRLAGALKYVENGQWIEIHDIKQFKANLAARNTPDTTGADHW